MPLPTLHRRSWLTVLSVVAAVEVMAGGVGFEMDHSDHHLGTGAPLPAAAIGGAPSRVAARPSMRPGATTTSPGAAGVTSGPGRSTSGATAGTASTAAAGWGGSQTSVQPAPAGTTAGAVAAPAAIATAGGAGATAPAVSCHTDLSLAQAPDTGYYFLCLQGNTPLTWAKNDLVFYESGLSLLQSVAMTTALAQWESAAGFSVSYTADRAAADVIVTGAPLASGRPGYTEDGYTTVAYRCAPGCAFDHADVELSSTAALTQTDWVSTVLHELGHVTGLNHVSQVGDVMYPYLTVTSPVLYAAGDRAGLAILAAERR